MFKYRIIPILLVVLMVWVACSDDDNPTGNTQLSVMGTWLYDSVVTNGVSDDIVVGDTIVFKTDFTGVYRTQFGWGSQVFDYSVRADSIYRNITSGQDVGMRDTILFEQQANWLSIQRVSASTDTTIVYLTRN